MKCVRRRTLMKRDLNPDENETEEQSSARRIFNMTKLMLIV